MGGAIAVEDDAERRFARESRATALEEYLLLPPLQCMVFLAVSVSSFLVNLCFHAGARLCSTVASE